jgi:hypothetical protein
MSWGAQNRPEDAKTPSVGRGMSRNPKPELCGIQRYAAYNKVSLLSSASCDGTYRAGELIAV